MSDIAEAGLGMDGSQKEATPDVTECGSGCACGGSGDVDGSKPGRSDRTRLAVSLIALLAVVGIVTFKLSHGSRPDPDRIATGDQAEPVASYVTTANGVVSQSLSPTQAGDEHGGASSPTGDGARFGQYLDALGQLNEVALDVDVVFIFIPAEKDEIVSETTMAALRHVREMLDASKIRTGWYTLRTTAPDSPTGAFELPAILVAYKGRRMAVVSGEVTNSKLLQAFVAASQRGGCSSSGCSASGCRTKVPGSGGK